MKSGDPTMENYTFRLKPGQDLFDSIALFVAENKLQSGCIMSGVGSLSHVSLRFANQEVYTQESGFEELVVYNV
jgi:predicted DNA-binding protein with PD1-like motif